MNSTSTLNGHTMTSACVREIVQYGTLAPSPHNLQGWHFIWDGDALDIRIRRDRLMPVLDPTNRETYIGHGAAIENIRVAASHFGHVIAVAYFPDPLDPDLVAQVRFTPAVAPSARTPLAVVSSRESNRRLFARDPLDADTVARIRAVLSGQPELTLHLLLDRKQIDESARLIRDAELVRFCHRDIHHEIVASMRFSLDETVTHRDGLALAAFEVTAPIKQRALQLLLSPRAQPFLRRTPLYRTVADGTRRLVRSASAVCLLTATESDNTTYVRGGEAWQRVLHELVMLEIATQPTSAPLELVHAAKSGYTGMFSASELARITDIRRRLYQLFPIDDGAGLLMIFRIGSAPPASFRSPRRPIDDVLTFAEAARRNDGASERGSASYVKP